MAKKNKLQLDRNQQTSNKQSKRLSQKRRRSISVSQKLADKQYSLCFSKLQRSRYNRRMMNMKKSLNQLYVINSKFANLVGQQYNAYSVLQNVSWTLFSRISSKISISLHSNALHMYLNFGSASNKHYRFHEKFFHSKASVWSELNTLR